MRSSLLVLMAISLLLPGGVPVAEAAGTTSPRLVEKASAAQRRARLTRRGTPRSTPQPGAERERAKAASVQAGPLKPSIDQSHRANFPDPKLRPTARRAGAYPWHFDITATYFYIGERPTKNNPTPNTASSWDSAWDDNYGGYDDPDPARRCPRTYAPLAFTPQLNPFYVALPYNDIQQGGPKPEAEKVIPWYHRDKEGKYESVCRGTWVQIYYNGRYCFAQWEDCGPFVTDDWQYVFGNARPKNTANKGAGIDISPAVRDYLGIKGGTANVHWRFVDFSLVPGGPWARFGKDNPFVNPALKHAVRKFQQHRRRKAASRASR